MCAHARIEWPNREDSGAFRLAKGKMAETQTLMAEVMRVAEGFITRRSGTTP